MTLWRCMLFYCLRAPPPPFILNKRNIDHELWVFRVLPGHCCLVGTLLEAYSEVTCAGMHRIFFVLTPLIPNFKTGVSHVGRCLGDMFPYKAGKTRLLEKRVSWVGFMLDGMMDIGGPSTSFVPRPCRHWLHLHHLFTKAKSLLPSWVCGRSLCAVFGSWNVFPSPAYLLPYSLLLPFLFCLFV